MGSRAEDAAWVSLEVALAAVPRAHRQVWEGGAGGGRTVEEEAGPVKKRCGDTNVTWGKALPREWEGLVKVSVCAKVEVPLCMQVRSAGRP